MKLAAMLFTICLVSGLAACSGSDQPPPKTNVFTPETQAMEKAKQVDAIVKKQAADQKKAADAINNQ